MTTSGSETEWVPLLEAEKIIFVIQLLKSMRISVELPVTARVHNVRAIFMTGNITAKGLTKWTSGRMSTNMLKIKLIRYYL